MSTLKKIARKHLSQESRIRIAGFGEGLVRNSADAVSAAVGTVLGILPARVLIGLRQRLELRRKLDFPDTPIRIQVTSPVEYHTRLWSCRKEPETVEWLRSVLAGEGSVLYDIGANIGAYSLIAGELLRGRDGIVYAFEPGFSSYSNLVGNIALNGLGATVVAMPLALSDKTGLATFGYSGTSAGAADHAGIVGGESGSTLSQSLLGCRLDDAVRIFSLRPPTAIKIDVDGAEEHVIAGAGSVLDGPELKHVLIEVDEESSHAKKIHDRLTTAGFRRVAAHPRGVGGGYNVIWSRA